MLNMKETPTFQTHASAPTGTSPCVCDLTADSDPDLHDNGSNMLVDHTGDSDSDRPPLQYNKDKTETRELETGVSMSWEMTEGRLREWDGSALA